jgi:Arc/MetJ-type ribon-helix-helix transcriptional regulator
MAQLNVHVTPEFEEALARLVRLRKLASKSEAVRVAVRETLERETQRAGGPDFRSWIGAARKVPLNPRPRFRSDDDLWESAGGD